MTKPILTISLFLFVSVALAHPVICKPTPQECTQEANKTGEPCYLDSQCEQIKFNYEKQERLKDGQNVQDAKTKADFPIDSKFDWSTSTPTKNSHATSTLAGFITPQSSILGGIIALILVVLGFVFKRKLKK